MINKFLLFIVVVFLAAAVWSSISFFGLYYYHFLPLATYTGLLMMFLNGTFKSTRYGVGIIGLILVAWRLEFVFYSLPGSAVLAPVSALFMLIAYPIHFNRKEEKTVLDFLKLLVVLVILVLQPLMSFAANLIALGLIPFFDVMNVIYAEPWTSIFFFVIFALFLVDLRRKNRL